MIDAVAFCPAAPFLIPGLASPPPDAVAVLRSCVEVTAALSSFDGVLVLSEATYPRVRMFGPGTPVGTAGLLRSDLPATEPVRLPGESLAANDGQSRAPDPEAGPGVGTVVGAHLLRAAGVRAPAWAVEVPVGGGPDLPARDPVRDTASFAHATPRDDGVSRHFDAGTRDPRGIADIVELLGRPDDASARIGVLALCDGATSHTPQAPLGVHPAAARVDGALVAAIATGSPAELSGWLRRDRTLADATGVRGRDVLAAVSGLVPGVMRARMVLCSAPFGVGYLVALWSR